MTPPALQPGSNPGLSPSRRTHTTRPVSQSGGVRGDGVEGGGGVVLEEEEEEDE